MDLKVPEKKLLSEPCWIELNDEVKIRIDYQTRNQEAHFNRLIRISQSKYDSAETEDWGIYYLRSTIKEVVGFTKDGKPLVAVLERGFLKELSNGETSIDLMAKFVDWDLVDAVAGMIRQRLEVSEVEKKSSSSPPSSSKTENLEGIGSPSIPAPESLTLNAQSIPVVGSIS
jgi:hypothetical protein